MRLFLLLSLLLAFSFAAISHPHNNDSESCGQDREPVMEQPIVNEDDCPDTLCFI